MWTGRPRVRGRGGRRGLGGPEGRGSRGGYRGRGAAASLLTFSSAALSGGCEPAAASPPAPLFGASIHGQSAEQRPPGPTDCAEQSPSGSTESAEQHPSGFNESAELRPSRSTESAKQSPSGPTESAEQSSSGPTESAGQRPCGHPESTEQRPCGHPESTEQRPSGPTESTEQRPSGPTESTEQRPSGPTESAEQRPSGHPESAEQRSSGHPESAEQRPSRNTDTLENAGPGLARPLTSLLAPEVPSRRADVCLRGFQRQQRNVVASKRDEMWSEGRYDYERLPRERAPPRSHASDGYHRVVNVVPKRPPLLDKRPPLLDKRPPLLARPDEGGYSRYYSHVDYREYDEGRSFSHDRRSGPPHRGDDSSYRWTRDDYSTSRQPEHRDMRDGFRRKSFYSSHYSRERSPHKRDTPVFRESPVGRKDSPHSRSGSSLSSRSYSPERSRTHSFHQSQHRKSTRVGASYKRQHEANPGRGKERSIQSLKTSRDTSPSSSSAVSSSKVLDKPSRLTEKELAEAASKWANEKPEKSDENNLTEISEFETGSMAPLFIDQTEEPESNTTDGTELYEDSQLSSRSKAIASKTKEIEQVYRQDCETFGMVVKMLIEKDPSLEKSIQFALRQNLHEIGERCVEELKHFITEYDNSTQDFGDAF